jgi:hypothetical protein
MPVSATSGLFPWSSTEWLLQPTPFWCSYIWILLPQLEIMGIVCPWNTDICKESSTRNWALGSSSIHGSSGSWLPMQLTSSGSGMWLRWLTPLPSGSGSPTTKIHHMRTSLVPPAATTTTRPHPPTTTARIRPNPQTTTTTHPLRLDHRLLITTSSPRPNPQTTTTTHPLRLDHRLLITTSSPRPRLLSPRKGSERVQINTTFECPNPRRN